MPERTYSNTHIDLGRIRARSWLLARDYATQAHAAAHTFLLQNMIITCSLEHVT